MKTLRVVAAAVFLAINGAVSAIPPLADDWHALTAVRSRPDPVSELDRAYKALVPWLPKNGRIGYKPTEDWPGADAVQKFYLAEYALTPRLIVMDTAPEFVIAHPGPPSGVEKGVLITPARDAQLAGFVLYETAESGLRIFRRAP